ncbi:MAG: HNH endonuclease [Patescibacteria group bacterium]|nr:HNH endonuclease [Patescibacteria group bacterium]
MKEINWKNIVEELSKTYSVSSEGKVINIKRNTEVVFSANRRGYLAARIWAPGISKNKDKRINVRMHRLVAMFHLKSFNPELQVNHKNGIKTDNRVENLEMVNNQYNSWHGWNVLDSKTRRENLGKRVKDWASEHFWEKHRLIHCAKCGKKSVKLLKKIKKDPAHWKRYCSWECYLKRMVVKSDGLHEGKMV